MRLELNLPALERLIGGDTEIEIGIREQIANEFAQRHLKALMNDAQFRKIHAAWQKELDAAVEAKCQEFLTELKQEQANVPLYKAKHGTWLSCRIQEAVEKAVDRAIDAAVADRVEKWATYIRQDIPRLAHAALARKVNEMVEEEIQRRLTLAKEVK